MRKVKPFFFFYVYHILCYNKPKEKGVNIMPSFVTHNKSYFDVYKILSEPIKKRYLGTWELYNMFAQGHDVIFTYIYFHLVKNIPKIKTLLKQMQTVSDYKIQAFTINYINLLEQSNLTAEEEIEAILFLYGYLIHHFLDAKMHPQIIYQTGDFQNDKQAATHHLLVENQIDAYMLKRDGIDPKSFKIHNIVTSKMALQNGTRRIVKGSFKETHGFDNFDQIYAEYNEMTRIFLKRLYYGPRGIKKRLFKPLDLILMGNLKPSQLIFDFEGTEAIPYLNQEKKLWTHPVDGTPSIQSATELYEEGIIEIAKMIVYLEEAILDKATAVQIAGIVPDISSIHGGKTNGDYTLSYTKKNHR